MIKKFYFIIVFIILFSNIAFAEESADSFVQAEVIEMVQSHTEETNNQIVKLRILEGKYKGQEIYVESLYIEYSEYSFDLHKGSKVLLKLSKNEKGEIEPYIFNISREDDLKILGIIFLAAVVIFGRTRGFLSVTSLGVSGFIIIKFMIPFIQKGYNPIFIAILSSIAIILISFILIAGFTTKSFVAILGTVGGTVIAGLLAQIFTNICSITGFSGEEVNYLINNLGVEIDYKGLYLSGVLIGSIGVVMDVAMTITSVIFELKKQSHNVSFSKLMNSGLQVGKDVMATMVNTLILAYIGGAMPLFLIIINYNMPFNQIMSMEIVSMEIIRSLCGSIGLILTIPLTSFIASMLVNFNKRSRMYGLKKS
ncbi:YibE/F family protein [Anaerovorax odorimutans]|uniref:YibE/F family protein n=1 Tax=Anaerovorax odorimutans TaxID=109327 RepID=UPI0003FF104E|nr:YibE/F family protein [Anaerovorax odorimutans]